ncbi:MAG: hypothetical protein Q9170_001118 [Blastenia crenularia]
MASSFKRNENIPPRYRTPSPPPRHAVELHSSPAHTFSGAEAPPLQRPTITHSHSASSQPMDLYTDKSEKHCVQPNPNLDTMDTFASIALSATSAWPAQNKRNTPTPPYRNWQSTDDNSERPAKRARSEKLPPPGGMGGDSKAASRPATSYESVADSRRMDAELLLNFSQNARLLTTSTIPYYNPCQPGTASLSNTACRPQDSFPQLLGYQGPYTLDTHRLGYRMELNENSTVQDSSAPGGGMPGPAPQIPDTNRRIIDALKIPLHNYRQQYDEYPKATLHQNRSANATGPLSSAPMPHHPLHNGNDPRLTIDGDQVQGVLAQKDQGAYRAGSESDPGLLELESAFAIWEPLKNRTQSAFTNAKDQISVNGYWPSMLATTVERSASAWKERLTQALQELNPKGQQTKPDLDNPPVLDPIVVEGLHAQEPATCAACKFMRNSMSAETNGESASWISCDGCKSWFHFACAGFKSEREVRAVDKYRCRKCKVIHGPTTYVRKSARAHTAIDYAGLNQGVVKTSDERPEHHYIQPIKDGTISFQPENFARMRPELVTAEHFEKGHGMKEPIVIPAEFNPRPRPVASAEPSPSVSSGYVQRNQSDTMLLDDWFSQDPECQNVPDHGQDALDMVIPPSLTVRTVAELYGPEEKVEVIDVKSQNGEGKKWNMRRWADYYESTSNKVVRNVISLEVSQSTLGRLIRRPQIVRDLDLQDDVWPAELQAKGEIPRVQFYCLMSVADCFTDFHVDFGGSSVFYHILKGKKTFFFIPPKEKHLKKYEEWCMSPAQNWTFLADQTKECYRVDLSEGDTMLIPAGWIHAVWTPEDSLVIGGNFLTRLNYSMQLRIAQVEKATGVARKFRYPHFQKIQWYTAIRYLESDPIPSDIRSELEAGGVFHRQHPAYHDLNSWGENSRSGPENYHARYYSQSELEGLPDLVRYLLRTALIDSGDITEGITAEARNAVKKSIPRGFGEPVEIVKSFAIWCAWKRGNESIPHWAHPDAVPEVRMTESAAKLSSTALKKLNRETGPQAPRRHSSRNQVQQPLVPFKETEASHETQVQNTDGLQHDSLRSNDLPKPGRFADGPLTPYKASLLDGENQQNSSTSDSTNSRKRKPAPRATTTTPRKTACDSCRRRRRACKHKTDQASRAVPSPHTAPSANGGHQGSEISIATVHKVRPETDVDQNVHHHVALDKVVDRTDDSQQVFPMINHAEKIDQIQPEIESAGDNIPMDLVMHESPRGLKGTVSPPKVDHKEAAPILESNLGHTSPSPKQGRGRSKACDDCRKSKRRCLHDENGREDPLKVQEAGNPRSATAQKRRKLEHKTQHARVPLLAQESPAHEEEHTHNRSAEQSAVTPWEQVQRLASPAIMVASCPPVIATTIDPTVVASYQPQVLLGDMDSQGSMEAEPPPSAARPETRGLTPSSVLEHATGIAYAVNQGPADSPDSPASVETRLLNTLPTAVSKHNIPTQLSNDSSFERPAASSLVSPPASSHDDSEQPALAVDQNFTDSGSSSRQSSRYPMHNQRFTPDSGPARRDSSISVAIEAPSVEIKSPSTSPASVQAPDSAEKRMRVRLGSEIEADEESLRLIKALQAEDYGLRRRISRVP